MFVIDSYEAADTIRALDSANANIPIIVMTADAFSEDKQRWLANGTSAHVSKPIDVREVINHLKKHTDKIYSEEICENKR